ncbi:MAG: SDR family oxidoreductase [Candidatus Riflebacteria bacterium]|nr:SDR family oxidoreductase [Candidatus Riflebacteria bacterium]
MAKTALITGGGSGLGFEIAKQLGQRGYDIVILGRTPEKLKNAVKAIQSEGYNAIDFQCDTTDENQLKSVFSEVKNRFGKIDFLILNAGVVTCKLLSDFKDTSELRHDLEINLWGTILSTYIFLPLVCSGGRILMISSAFGLMGPAAYSVYAASKAGILNFGESLRRELLCKNISVHVACPGDIDTPQLHEEHKKMPEWFKKDDPRGALSAGVAAERILKQCFENTFLIIISFEIFSLVMLNKCTPRKLRDYLLDRMFPRPNDKAV